MKTSRYRIVFVSVVSAMICGTAYSAPAQVRVENIYLSGSSGSEVAVPIVFEGKSISSKISGILSYNFGSVPADPREYADMDSMRSALIGQYCASTLVPEHASFRAGYLSMDLSAVAQEPRPVTEIEVDYCSLIPPVTEDGVPAWSCDHTVSVQCDGTRKVAHARR